MLDWIGRASVLTDLDDKSTTSGRLLAWAADVIVQTPWYVPTIFAAFVTAGWIFMMARFHNQLSLLKAAPSATGESDFAQFMKGFQEKTTNLQQKQNIPEGDRIKLLPKANRPIEYFCTLLKNENGLFADASLRPYIGTAIDFECSIQPDNIQRLPDDSFSVGVELPNKTFVICRFGSKHENYLGRANKGEIVNVSGSIEGRLGKTLRIELCHPTET